MGKLRLAVDPGKVRAARLANAMSVRQAGELAGFGSGHRAERRWRLFESKPQSRVRLDVLTRLEETLHVSAARLLTAGEANPRVTIAEVDARGDIAVIFSDDPRAGCIGIFSPVTKEGIIPATGHRVPSGSEVLVCWADSQPGGGSVLMTITFRGSQLYLGNKTTGRFSKCQPEEIASIAVLAGQGVLPGTMAFAA